MDEPSGFFFWVCHSRMKLYSAYEFEALLLALRGCLGVRCSLQHLQPSHFVGRGFLGVVWRGCPPPPRKAAKPPDRCEAAHLIGFMNRGAKRLIAPSGALLIAFSGKIFTFPPRLLQLGFDFVLVIEVFAIEEMEVIAAMGLNQQSVAQCIPIFL